MNPAFPGALAMLFDSSIYQVELQDTSLQSPIEGGYVVTRSKTTRRGRRNFTVAMSSITDEQKALLDTFYLDTAAGGAVMFDWIDPPSANFTPITLTVRFIRTIVYTYVGVKNTHSWNATMVFGEV